MKIALVSQEYPPETARGGIGSQTYTKAHGLAALGHQVYVISRSITSDKQVTISGGVQVIRIPGMEKQLPEMSEPVQWLSHSLLVAAEIEALHAEVNLDIIDFPEWAAEGYAYLLNCTSWKKIPVVIQLHGPLVMLAHTINWPDMKSSFYKVGCHMEATCIQMADAIYSSSECSAKWIRNYYKPSGNNIPVIHMGIDTSAFLEGAKKKYEQLTIAYAGRLVQNKGVEELVTAVILLSKEFNGLQLKLMGKGDEKFIKKIREIAYKAEAIEMIDFVGFVDKENLAIEFLKAHVFAAPSYYEGGPGFVYLEAMACGLPVIGCSGSGVEEIINEGINGYLVPPKDVAALTDALRKMLSDVAGMERMGKNARAYVVREADSKYCVQKLEAFYYSVLKKSKALA